MGVQRAVRHRLLFFKGFRRILVHHYVGWLGRVKLAGVQRRWGNLGLFGEVEHLGSVDSGVV